MKILFTIESLNRQSGGPARSVPGLAGALVANGVDVSIWTRNPPDPANEHQELLSHLKRFTGSLDNLYDFDLVHDHGLWLPSNHSVSEYARRHRIPRVVSPRGMLEPWALKYKWLKKKVAWFLYQKRDLLLATGLHATSYAEAEQFKKLGLNQTVVIEPNGIDLPDSRVISNCRAQSGQRTMLFMSRIHVKKGLLLFAEAWAKVRPKNWNVIVAGPDVNGYRRTIEATLSRLDIAADWTFAGEVYGDKKWELLSASDVLILPSYSENFGIVIAEALAAGTPVITTEGTPWNRLIEENCGWWVPATTESIANAINEATSQTKETLDTMGQLGKSWIEREYTWPNIAKRMLDFYHKLLS